MTDVHPPRALDVSITDDTLTVDLADGRSISVPIDWYPRLLHAAPEERANWYIVGEGDGVHWPDLDEDIQAEALVSGRRSQESARSLQRWLNSRGG